MVMFGVQIRKLSFAIGDVQHVDALSRSRDNPLQGINMPALTEHLLSTTTCHRSASEAIAFPEDALAWGLEMMARNGSEAALQMSPAPGADVIHLPVEDARRLQIFRERILEGLPVHGRLALIDFCSGEGTLRDQADWAWQAFHAEFREPLERVHPMGFYMMAMLWMSCGEHVYASLCETPGLLHTLQGVKAGMFYGALQSRLFGLQLE